jgi:hypothetical protein
VRIWLADAFPGKKVYVDPLQQDLLGLLKNHYADSDWAQPFISGNTSVNKLATAVAAQFRLGTHRANLRTSLWRSVRAFVRSCGYVSVGYQDGLTQSFQILNGVREFSVLFPQWVEWQNIQVSARQKIVEAVKAKWALEGVSPAHRIGRNQQPLPLTDDDYCTDAMKSWVLKKVLVVLVTTCCAYREWDRSRMRQARCETYGCLVGWLC